VQPDKIKLLTPQQVAALGPAKVAALADVCLEWGPLSEADRVRALAELEPFQLGKLLTQRRSEQSYSFWVYLPAVATRADAERRAEDAKVKGTDRRRRRRDAQPALRRVAGSLRERGQREGPSCAGSSDRVRPTRGSVRASR
jgi:hypothetical protein